MRDHRGTQVLMMLVGGMVSQVHTHIETWQIASPENWGEKTPTTKKYRFFKKEGKALIILSFLNIKMKDPKAGRMGERRAVPLEQEGGRAA